MFHNFFPSFLVLLLVGCQNLNQPQSVLIIAVEGLGATDLPCAGEPTTTPRSGFQILCQEGVRYSHAMTPSLLSRASMSSILTGQYPFQTQVHHNQDILTPLAVTLPEILYQNKFRTSFFSSGSPIMRKSGLHQGFEFFNDSIPRGKVSKPASLIVTEFLDWQKDQNGRFFSVLYLSDKSYPFLETRNELNEVRPFRFTSQNEEIDENLFKLFQQLKNRKAFHNSTIILVGLQGSFEQKHTDEFIHLNLHRERTQVAFIIKPPQKPRDAGIHWNIDETVSLVDIFPTILDILQIPNTNVGYSLASTLKSSKSPWKENRRTLSESAWSFWQLSNSIRQSTFQSPNLVIMDQPPKKYNTLTDQFENTSTAYNFDWEDELSSKDSEVFKDFHPNRFSHYSDEKITQDLTNIMAEFSSQLETPLLQKSCTNQRCHPLVRDILFLMKIRKAKHEELIHWMSSLTDLKPIAKIFVEQVKSKRFDQKNICADLSKNPPPHLRSFCQSDLVNALQHMEKNAADEDMKEHFLHLWSVQLAKERMARLNLKSGLYNAKYEGELQNLAIFEYYLRHHPQWKYLDLKSLTKKAEENSLQ